MGGGSNPTSSHGTGTLAASQLQGNSGKFIVQLIRSRTDNKKEPTIITESLWQIVKAVPGTWLTAVAKYGLKWPDKHLHRVYFNEYVQACEPGSDDTKAEYNFFDFEEGGKWEDGISKSPKEAKARDKQVEVDSYWGFKIKEIVVYQKPGMDDDEILKKRKKMLDVLFEKALALNDKKELLDKLKKLEQNLKAIMNSKMSEEQKLAEFDKLLAELKENVSKHAVDKDVADAIESWYRSAQKLLDESVKIKDRMGKRVAKEIKYLKFRSAEYDLMHDKDQQVKKVQKGTPEEDQWKKMLPLLPLKKPAEKKKLFTPRPSISAPSKAIPTV
jgi:hypothetical protein